MTESTLPRSKPETSSHSESPFHPPQPSPEQFAQAPGDQPFRDGLMFNVVIPLSLIAAAILVFLLLGAVQTPQRPPADMTRTGRLRALTPVRVEQLQTLESTGKPLYLVVDGTVVPYQEARVAAEVGGRVIEKSGRCEAGSYVRKDELLMRIDPTDYRLEVQRLSRLQEQEYQALQEVDQEMANSQRLIEVAKKDVALQEREVARQTALPEGFTSRAEIDQANRTLLAAQQQLVTVENQLELQRKRRVRLEASERLAATQLQAAEVNLQRTEIRAPIEGVIVSEEADLNTFVSRGSPLITIEDTSKVDVSTSLRMDQLYWILDQAGQTTDDSARSYNLPETAAIIEYELSGREGAVYRWEGRLLSYDGIGLDPTTRTVPVRVVVDNPTAFVDEQGNQKQASGATPLVRGMFVRVKLLIHPQTPLFVIPSTALQPGNRLYQFIPDESVLEVDPALMSEAAASTESADANAAPQVDDLSSPFNPSHWEPGRVVVRRSVNPVDSLSIDDSQGSNEGGYGVTRRNQLWVCEVRGISTSQDAFVVTSPLGSIEDESFPVRAERENSATDPNNTNSSDTIPGAQAEDQPTAAVSTTIREDA